MPTKPKPSFGWRDSGEIPSSLFVFTSDEIFQANDILGLQLSPDQIDKLSKLVCDFLSLIKGLADRAGPSMFILN